MDALAQVLASMRSIDAIVEHWSHNPPLNGKELADRLLRWNEEGMHDVRWIHKKAYSAMRTHVVGPLVEDMNEGLGIERDHRD